MSGSVMEKIDTPSLAAFKRPIGELLLEREIIHQHDLEFALEHQKHSKSGDFLGQILIRNSGRRFLAGGDSGSLMVQDVTTNPRPVGLLFAGSSTIAVAAARTLLAAMLPSLSRTTAYTTSGLPVATDRLCSTPT